METKSEPRGRGPITATLILTECDVMMSDVLGQTMTRTGARSRYSIAVDRLRTDAAPGFPARTPGSGMPGGGSGANVAPADGADEVPDNAPLGKATQPERLALAAHHDELDALARLNTAPDDLLHLVGALGQRAGLTDRMRNLAQGRGRMMAVPLGKLDFAHTILRSVLTASTTSDCFTVASCNKPWRAIARLHADVTAWGYIPSTPKQGGSTVELLANDPTGMWCRCCLSVGKLEPRYRGDLCSWCYRFERANGFMPPTPIRIARAEGRRITEAMVDAARKAHRERADRKRRRRVS